MQSNIKELYIELDDKEVEKFEHFEKIFLEYNKKVNLISKNDSLFLYEKHIFDSLSFNLFYRKYINKDSKLNLMDIGTGGGFPSIPISIKFNNIETFAIDSINKKINFIKYAAKELDIKNIHPLCLRAEETDIKMMETFDITVSRAMASLNIILEYAIPFLKTGGFFIAYKSIKAEEEIEKSQNALKVLNAEIIDKIEYSLPITEENKRNLIIIKKTGKTPKEFPRKNGIIKKYPL